jgi:hypothetical protein
LVLKFIPGRSMAWVKERAPIVGAGAKPDDLSRRPTGSMTKFCFEKAGVGESKRERRRS